MWSSYFGNQMCKLGDVQSDQTLGRCLIKPRRTLSGYFKRKAQVGWKWEFGPRVYFTTWTMLYSQQWLDNRLSSVKELRKVQSNWGASKKPQVWSRIKSCFMNNTFEFGLGEFTHYTEDRRKLNMDVKFDEEHKIISTQNLAIRLFHLNQSPYLLFCCTNPLVKGLPWWWKGDDRESSTKRSWSQLLKIPSTQPAIVLEISQKLNTEDWRLE